MINIKQDFDIFGWLESMPVLHAAAKKVLRRHVMHKTSNKQFQAGLEATGGRWSPKLFQVAASHVTGVTSRQICEDVIGYRKNSPQTSATKRYRRPELSMYMSLKAEVLTVRHRYATPSMELPMERSRSTLPK